MGYKTITTTHARYTAHVSTSDKLIGLMNAPYEKTLTVHDGGLWRVEDWLSGGVKEISPETTDAAIESLADMIVDEAAAENVVVVAGREAVRAYLLDYRQELRDAIPEPDCYQIRGYVVLEGTAKNFGGTAHVTVPRKYSGKRVKIVVLDP